MKKILLVLSILVLLVACSAPTNNAVGAFYRSFTAASAPGLSQQTSGAQESIVLGNGGWVMTAGGYVASTHYARLKYNLPELANIVPTTFYLRVVAVLPSDFYTRQTVGFRIVNIGNSGATLNGQPVGSSSSTVMFTSVYFNSDHSLRVVTSYGGNSQVFYTHPTQIPVGQHTFELYGDVANVAPWYLKIDGVQVASGSARLSLSTVPVAERVVTRAVAGIDGAAGLSTNTLSVQINELAFADYDVNAVTPSNTATSVPTSTPTIVPSVTNTATVLPTITAQPTVTLPVPTPTLLPLMTSTPECFMVSVGQICFTASK